MSAIKLTWWDELRLWWELSGELQLDLLTYYGICCTVGYLQGWYIGQLILRLLP